MKPSGDQFFLWPIAICCLPLLLVYLSLISGARVIGWLTDWPFWLTAGLVLVGLVYFQTNRNDCENEEKDSKPDFNSNQSFKPIGVIHVDQSA